MRVPDFRRPLLAVVLLVSAAVGQNDWPAGAEPVASPPPVVQEFPPLQIPRFPTVLVEPTLTPPSAALPEKVRKGKKLKAKYDVSLIGERGIGKGLNFYSLEKEIAIGRQLAHELEMSSRLLQDAVVTEYINRIGQNIVRNSDAKVPFIIKVLDNEEVNAFALPGGYFYVNTGLILAAENEAELAGVMAHEIAHVAARHATKNATKSELWNLASIPLIFVGGSIGYSLQQVAGVAVPMTFLKFNRNAEKEADLLGVEYQYATGYDPAAYVQFFEKLRLREKEKPNFLAKAFSTHPMTEDRIRHAQDTISKYLPEKDEYVITTSEFDEVKARLVRLMDAGRIDGGQGVRPTLRRRTQQENGQTSAEKDEEPPVLKRRDD